MDEEQVNLTRFDLFFPEKRPFFLENAGFFQFGVPQQTDVFFSRQIGIDAVTRAQVPILGGGRLSGKVGRFSMGVLDMQTEEVDGVAPANNFFVARVSREFHTRSTVGFIATNREATSADTFGNSPYNRVWGVDSNIGLGQYTTFFSYFAKTSTPDLTGRDHSGRILVDHVGPLWQFQGGYTEVGEDFNPEIGFVPRKGYRSPIIRAGFSPEPDWSGIRQFTPHLTLRRHYGFDGLLESEWQHYDYRMTFDNGANLGAQFNSFYEYLREPFDVFPGVVDPISVGGYRYNQWLVRGGSDPSAPLFISGAYTKGSFYSGDLRTWDFEGGVRLGAKLLGTVRYATNDVVLPQGDFRTHLGAAKVSYSFTPRRFVQAFVQYNSRFRLVTSNFRLGFIRDSGTGLFLVYNEQYEALNGNFPALNRALLLKYSHLFNF